MGSGSRHLAQITGPAKDKGMASGAGADVRPLGFSRHQARRPFGLAGPDGPEHEGVLRTASKRVFLIKPQIRDRRSRKADRPPVPVHGRAKRTDVRAGL
jgi:hypothetical protein